jgi:hypothetical protein
MKHTILATVSLMLPSLLALGRSRPIHALHRRRPCSAGRAHPPQKLKRQAKISVSARQGRAARPGCGGLGAAPTGRPCVLAAADTPPAATGCSSHRRRRTRRLHRWAGKGSSIDQLPTSLLARGTSVCVRVRRTSGRADAGGWRRLVRQVGWTVWIACSKQAATERLQELK